MIVSWSVKHFVPPLPLLPPRLAFLESVISMKFPNTFHPYRSVNRIIYVASLGQIGENPGNDISQNFLSPPTPKKRDFSPPSFPSQTDPRWSQGDVEVMESTNIKLTVRNTHPPPCHIAHIYKIKWNLFLSKTPKPQTRYIKLNTKQTSLKTPSLFALHCYMS